MGVGLCSWGLKQMVFSFGGAKKFYLRHFANPNPVTFETYFDAAEPDTKISTNIKVLLQI
jgi:hypothetical protein